MLLCMPPSTCSLPGSAVSLCWAQLWSLLHPVSWVRLAPPVEGVHCTMHLVECIGKLAQVLSITNQAATVSCVLLWYKCIAECALDTTAGVLLPSLKSSGWSFVLLV